MRFELQRLFYYEVFKSGLLGMFVALGETRRES